MFHPFFCSIILRNSNRSTFHHNLQTFEHTPEGIFPAWWVTALHLFPCPLFMEICSFHGHSSCWSNFPGAQLWHFCYKSLMCICSIFLPRKLHNSSTNRAALLLLDELTSFMPWALFCQAEIGQAGLFQLPWQMWWVHFSILPHCNWPICAVWKQQGNWGRQGKDRGKRFPSSLFYSGRTGLFNCILIYEN